MRDPDNSNRRAGCTLTRTYLLDGLRIAAPAGLPLPPVEDQPDWVVAFAASELPEPEWGGEAAEDGLVWARFGRAGTRSVVDLDRVLRLAADVNRRHAWIASLDAGHPDLYVLRRAMPYLVHLSGGTALHAACVVAGDDTWLICGEPRQGKSTLALALDAAGHAVLADDHVALTLEDGGAIMAEVSFPFADVHEDAVAALRPDVEGHVGKDSVPLLTPRPDRARVTRLAFLGRGEREERVPVPAPEVARRLLADVIFLGDPSSREEQERRLDVATALATSVPAIDLTVPRGLEHLRSFRL